MVVNRLPSRNPKRLKTINLMVVRVALDGSLRNSKPCLECVKYMVRARTKGYHINRIYYSTDQGKIVSMKLQDLLCDPFPHHSKGTLQAQGKLPL